MLFHLKEPDYKTVHRIPQPPTNFYGRTPEQIFATLEFYLKKIQKDGVPRDHPDLVWWLKRDFTRDDIEEVNKGGFAFVTGMLYLGEEVADEPFYEELKVTDDFTVYVPKENIGHFTLWRMRVSQMKRGELYELRNPIDAFMNTSFVPEDIANAIVAHDLTPYTEAVKQDIARRERLSRGSLRVDGLQKILEAQAEPAPPKQN